MSDLTVTLEWRRNGRRVEPGTELSVKGERGRFRFRGLVRTEAGAEWVNVYGGPANRAAWRSFDPERITIVHRTTKVRP